MSKAIKITNKNTGDTRRVAVEEWPDLVSLDATLRSIFGASLPSSYTLQYRDEDGDVVSITSSLELLEAAQTAQRISRGARPTLNLTVGNATASGVGSVVLNKPSHLIVDSFLLPPLSNHNTTNWANTANSSSASSRSPQKASVGRVYTDECGLCSRVRRLCSRGFGWRQSVKALVLTGGRVEPAQAALEQAGIRQNEGSAPARFYFDDEFSAGVAELVSAGFGRGQAVAALLRAGGVTSNAALDLAGVFKQEEESKKCDRCRTQLQLTCEGTGVYSSGWFCDRCRKGGKAHAFRWKCPSCEFDVCFACEPAPPSLPASAATTSTVVRNLPTKPTVSAVYTPPSTHVVQSSEPDYSLPDSLRSTVISLEKMGFTDRMRNIELLVKHGGDVQKVATFLLQEEAKKKAEEERLRAREEARLRAEREREKARIRAEERKRQQQLEKRRQEAARVAVASPEKIGEGIAHLTGMGFDPISSTSSLFNAGGDLEKALQMLLLEEENSL